MRKFPMGRRMRRAGCAALIVACAAMMMPLPVYAAGGILVFGDSLSAAHGIAQSDGWVALLRERLQKQRKDIEVVNASISGETTAGGKARLPAALDKYQPAIVVLELGGNDGLRALPVADMKANLDAMIDASRAAGAKVLLLGMRIPSNYGKAYSDRFHRVFDTIAKEKGVAYVPFFLEPIALDQSNFQADGIHPTAAAQPALLDAVWPKLSQMMKELRQNTAATSGTNTPVANAEATTRAATARPANRLHTILKSQIQKLESKGLMARAQRLLEARLVGV